ncbi:MAG: fused MFS/spermidine synthase [Gallionella sp.]|nr:fused MFS/spermidine synthase [Gallionella sp.]
MPLPTFSLNYKNSSGISWCWLVAFLYCLSGVTSLAYEVLWARMLSMQFGVSIFGVVLTVAAFMFGLGLGSLAGARWINRCNAPLTLFAVLEIAIAMYAIMLPNWLRAISGWMEGVAAQFSLTQWYLLQGAEVLCLLFIPALAMGVGFALVLKVVDRTPLSLGKLYGFNTLGGVVGALLPLWSLPVLGWINSVRVVALLGFVVGVAALVLSKFTQPSDATIRSVENNRPSRPVLRTLMIYAGIGAGSIMLEIGWIRMYGMVMLRTEYVLGVILAVFLLGIALGSMLLPRKHNKWLPMVLASLTGGGVLLSVWLLPSISTWVENSQFQSFFGALWSQAIVLVMVTLPVTLALGAWLPLLADRFGSTDSSGVWLYGANCLGGGVGAVLASLLFMPLVGSPAMLSLAGLIIVGLGLLWAHSRWAWLILLAMLPIAWAVRGLPPVHELLPKIEANSSDLYLYEDAISLTHVVRQQNGQRILLSDLQRMDASTEPSAVEIQKDQARLALLLHSEPHSVLFLGLGTGISVAGSQPFPELQRTAVELSQGSIFAATQWFSPVNNNVMDQAQIVRDDARHFLSSTPLHYDVIIGDLFHPDLAGMGSLLSVQQFQRARNHLNVDGIFVQWLALNQFDIQSLKVVLRSFRMVFPNAQMFMDGMHLALVGPKNSPPGAQGTIENLHRMAMQTRTLATGNEGVWTWLGRYWGPITESDGPIQDEWMPYIEYSLPRARYDGNVNLENMMMWLLHRHPDTNTAADILGVDAADKSQFGRAYVATELAVRAWVASIQGDGEKSGRLIWLAYQANPRDRWIANALADNMLQSLSQASQHGFSQREALQKILKVYPDHVGALRALWHLEQASGNTQAAESYHSRLLALSPLDSEVNVTS